MVAAASNRQGGSIVATIIGVVTLLFGASGVFGELQDSLNTIWEVQPKPGLGFFATLKKRFFSFAMVLGVGFLLLVSLVISAALAALGGMLGGAQEDQSLIWKAINFAISFGVTTLLFALIYKILPDAKVQWRDVWIGAVVTALLFSIGKAALGWYLARPTTTSSYGAAGSFVALLLWVYYSAQILFLGAEFTQVYAKMYGSKIQPDEDAVPVTEEARAQQGIPRREQLEETEALKEREVGSAEAARPANRDRAEAVSSSNGDRGQAISSSNGERAPADSHEASNRKPGGAAAVAGFLVGLVIGRRQRTHK
jgi:membrane protein